MNNLEKMNTFPEMYNYPRLSQEEVENMNRLITINENESIKTNKQINKQTPLKIFQDQMASYVNSTKYLKKS